MESKTEGRDEGPPSGRLVLSSHCPNVPSGPAVPKVGLKLRPLPHLQENLPVASITSPTQLTSTLCPDVTVMVWSPHCHVSMHCTARTRHFSVTCRSNTDGHHVLLFLCSAVLRLYLCFTAARQLLLHRCPAVI